MNHQDRQRSVSTSDAQLTTQLVLVTVALLVLTAPQYIRYTIYTKIDIYRDVETFALYYMLVHITNKMLFLNSSINFFLYCFGGSKFRRETLQILKCSRKNVVGTFTGEQSVSRRTT